MKNELACLEAMKDFVFGKRYNLSTIVFFTND